MVATLIGREHPAALLRAEVARTAQSHGGLVLITGEAGIGKTTLLGGALEEARELGALVLGGSCWDSANAPGYWPWTQVLRALRRALGEQEWARIAPGPLSVLLGESPNSQAEDGFALSDAVTTALVTVSTQRPVVVALDDLHWADSASLGLLEFAARHTWFERLLLIGTYRDAEVEAAEHPLRPLITPLLGTATTVTLTGLSAEEVGALLARTTGDEAEPSVVAEVHRRTGGNPFFVEQAARLWRAGGSIDAIAPGVRDAVRRRLDVLPGAVHTTLTAASVLGREFHRRVLAATMATPVAQLNKLLDQAATARLVTPLGGGRFAFDHDLVRESLYDAMNEQEHNARHAAVVHVLDQQQELTEQVPPAELARHAYRAGTDVPPSRVVDHLVAAARDAIGRLATDESIGHLRLAHERAAYDPKRQAVVALDLGRDLYHLSQPTASWQLLDEAIGTARALGSGELLARVALTLARGDTDADPDLVDELLRTAHTTLFDAAAAPAASTEDLVDKLTDQLTKLARDEADDDTLSFGLWARYDSLWGPATAKEREALTDELTVLARRIGDIESEQLAVSLKWVVLLEQGNPRYLEQYNLYISMLARADRRSARISSMIDQQIVCTLRGRFVEAADLLAQVWELTTEQLHDLYGYLGHQMRWSMWLVQGRFDELGPLHATTGQSGHPHPALLESVTAAQRGDAERVRELAGAVAADEPYQRFFRPLWLRYVAQSAALCGGSDDCEQARAALEPLRGLWLVSMYGSDISGPVDFWSGLLDAAQQRYDDAVPRLRAALATAERLGALPWAAEARAKLAEVLRARNGEGDAEAAGMLREQADREAAELGMRLMRTRLSEPDTDAAATHPSPEAAPSGGEFHSDGAMWTLGFAGSTVHLPDTKGLRDLHALLSSPGTDIEAVRLLDPAGGAELVAARRLGGDTVLDEQAKTAYQQRIAALDEQIEQAVHRGSDDRAARLDTERAALLDELRASTGLGGRPRRLGDEAERARKTVTARIRDTLRKLDAAHPALAAHLRSAVTTGANCRYTPERGLHWRL